MSEIVPHQLVYLPGNPCDEHHWHNSTDDHRCNVAPLRRWVDFTAMCCRCGATAQWVWEERFPRVQLRVDPVNHSAFIGDGLFAFSTRLAALVEPWIDSFLDSIDGKDGLAYFGTDAERHAVETEGNDHAES